MTDCNFDREGFCVNTRMGRVHSVWELGLRLYFVHFALEKVSKVVHHGDVVYDINVG